MGLSFTLMQQQSKNVEINTSFVPFENVRNATRYAADETIHINELGADRCFQNGIFKILQWRLVHYRALFRSLVMILRKFWIKIISVLEKNFQ